MNGLLHIFSFYKTKSNIHRASIDAACIVTMWLKCFVFKCVNQVASVQHCPQFMFTPNLNDTFKDKASCHMITIQAASILALCIVTLWYLLVTRYIQTLCSKWQAFPLETSFWHFTEKAYLSSKKEHSSLREAKGR